MEVLDNKEQEVVANLNPSPKEESKPSPQLKGNDSDKIAVENGVNGDGGKKLEAEKETVNNVREENNRSPVNSNKQPDPVSVKQNSNKVSDTANKKSSREEKYSRRKDERSVEQVMRALNAFESPQDKLDALVKKYAEVIDENRKLQTQTKNIERRLTQVEREKDSAQSEHSKAVLARSRLEGLCRELQRQNRAIKDESVLKIREEEEKRKEVSNKFQSTLAEITSLMQQNNEKNSKLRDDNIEMTTKFKSVCEQYELRVQQVEKISTQMQLEAQLADAKLAKAHLEAKAEKEVMLRDKQELLMELAQYQARAREQTETELRLREQVDLYTNKYDEFQTALSRSNEVFGGFKQEMERMSKKIVKLEKETSTWKLRWENSHKALLEMATDKQQRDAELAVANRQLSQLHKLCRTLTEERAKLMAQINAAGAPADTAKEEKLAADIADDRRKLNDTLDSLQSVILERELLHKQQLLEKQQQQLQVELQKHIAAAAGEPKEKASDAMTTSKVEPKASDTKLAETKVSGNKNTEANKKKGKNKKAGRQAVEKQVSSEESNSEAKETSPENTENATSETVPPAKEERLETQGDSDTTPKDVTTDIASPTSAPIDKTDVGKEVEPKEKEVTSAEIVTASSPVTPAPKILESQAPVETELPPQAASVPVPELPSAPAAFSYAAAVGSKPTEHPLVEKCQSEKTEEKPAVVENETAAPVVSVDSSCSSEAVNGGTNSALPNPNTAVEETCPVASSPVPSTKKSKESNKKRKNK